MFGAAKRAHHAREEQMRRDTEIRNAYEASQRAAEASLQQQIDAAREAAARWEQQNQVLLDQLNDLTISNNQAIEDQRAFYEDQAAKAQAAADRQIQGLNDLMMQNKAAFDQQIGVVTAQYEAAQAAYADQKRRSDNAARASVPGQQETATAPVVGDTREAVTETRKQKDNQLSNLSIVSNPATNTQQQLAGLQIA